MSGLPKADHEIKVYRDGRVTVTITNRGVDAGYGPSGGWCHLCEKYIPLPGQFILHMDQHAKPGAN